MILEPECADQDDGTHLVLALQAVMVNARLNLVQVVHQMGLEGHHMTGMLAPEDHIEPIASLDESSKLGGGAGKLSGIVSHEQVSQAVVDSIRLVQHMEAAVVGPEVLNSGRIIHGSAQTGD